LRLRLPHAEEAAQQPSRSIAKVSNTDGASIYILRCADGSYYTGITRRSVDERVSDHAQGLIDGYTARRLPVELVLSEHYERVDGAIAAERRIKGWSRAKKEAYIRGADVKDRGGAAEKHRCGEGRCGALEHRVGLRLAIEPEIIRVEGFHRGGADAD